MVRTYSQQTSVILPRLNAPYAYILLSQVQTAATAQQAQLEANSGGLPQFIARPLARLNAATLALGLALQLAPPPADTAATRAADTTFDNAWGGLHQFLSAALKLAPGLNPDPAGTPGPDGLALPRRHRLPHREVPRRVAGRYRGGTIGSGLRCSSRPSRSLERLLAAPQRRPGRQFLVEIETCVILSAPSLPALRSRAPCPSPLPVSPAPHSA